MKSITLGLFAILATESSAIKFRPTEGSTPWHKQETGSTWLEPKWPVNYVVPQFGVDHDIKDSLAHSEKLNMKADADGKFPVPENMKF